MKVKEEGKMSSASIDGTGMSVVGAVGPVHIRNLVTSNREF